MKYFGDPNLLIRAMRREPPPAAPAPAHETAPAGLPRALAAHQAARAAHVLELATMPSDEFAKQIDAMAETPVPKPVPDVAAITEVPPGNVCKEIE
jgi:hypothetical protein